MPDISMCVNRTCSLRERCYRYVAKPSRMQSMMLFKPMLNSNPVKCSDFISTDNIIKHYLRDAARVDAACDAAND